MSQLKTETATRAFRLLVKFQHGNSYMALTLAEDMLGQLETLNSYLQSKKMTLGGMKAANDEVVKSLDTKRTSDHSIEASSLSLILMTSGGSGTSHLKTLGTLN